VVAEVKILNGVGMDECRSLGTLTHELEITQGEQEMLETGK